MLEKILFIAQIVLPILLISSILLQAKGTGLGATFGGDGNVFRSKRGIEKKLYQFTIIIAIIFFATALANVLIS